MAILNRFSDRIDVYFVVDAKWKAHLEKIDSRFKYGVFEYDRPGGDQRLMEIVDKLESSLRYAKFTPLILLRCLTHFVSFLYDSMNVLEKAKLTWELFVKGRNFDLRNFLSSLNSNLGIFHRIDEALIELDAKSEQQIKKIQPDFREYLDRLS